MEFLWWSFGLLLFAHLISTYLLVEHGIYIKRFDFNHERNFPTFFATFQLAFAGILLWHSFKAATSKSFSVTWKLLSFVFLFLAFDEFFQIHDQLGARVSDVKIQTSSWVAPYMAGLAGLSVIGVPWFFNLPLKTRWAFFISGTIFVTGAAGVEIVGDILKTNFGFQHLYYRLAVTVEESCEFIGLTLFIKALLDYYFSQKDELSLPWVDVDCRPPIETSKPGEAPL